MEACADQMDRPGERPDEALARERGGRNHYHDIYMPEGHVESAQMGLGQHIRPHGLKQGAYRALGREEGEEEGEKER